MILVGTLVDGEEIYISREMDDVLFTGADGDTYLSMKEEGILPEEEKKFALDGIKSLELATLNPAFLIEYDLLVKDEEEEEVEEIDVEPDPSKEADFTPDELKKEEPKESVKRKQLKESKLNEIATKKLFIKVASIIKAEKDAAVKDRLASKFISIFKADNPRFDTERFNKACGLSDSSESIKEARMGVDYIKSLKAALKKAREALKIKDYEAAAEALEDVKDDADDAARAAKKMKRDADNKEEKEKDMPVKKEEPKKVEPKEEELA